MIHARGDRYEGECKDGKFHGEGTYTWAVGNTYKGEWRNDKGHGQGVYVWADVRSPPVQTSNPKHDVSCLQT
jgi:hypothetical protein